MALPWASTKTLTTQSRSSWEMVVQSRKVLVATGKTWVSIKWSQIMFHKHYSETSTLNSLPVTTRRYPASYSSFVCRNQAACNAHISPETLHNHGHFIFLLLVLVWNSADGYVWTVRNSSINTPVHRASDHVPLRQALSAKTFKMTSYPMGASNLF